MKFVLFLFASILLTTCTTTTPRFHQMSEEELYLYNLERPVRERVVCLERENVMSRIPRRRCYTVAQLGAETVEAAASINTIMPGAN